MPIKSPPRFNPSPFVITQKAEAMFDRFTPTPPQKPPFAVSNDGTTQVAAAGGPVDVTARLESTVEGLCPYCNGSMRKSSAADQPVWICDSDRHVVPVRNP